MLGLVGKKGHPSDADAQIEYLVVKLDEDKETAAVSLEAQNVLRTLSEIDWKGTSVWHPEYGRFMLESTPAGPYGSRLKDLVGV